MFYYHNASSHSAKTFENNKTTHVMNSNSEPKIINNFPHYPMLEKSNAASYHCHHQSSSQVTNQMQTEKRKTFILGLDLLTFAQQSL